MLKMIKVLYFFKLSGVSTVDRAEFEQKLESFLLEVTTPGQYIGREWNSVVKPTEEVACRVALCFPDAYAVGMSHHGLRVPVNPYSKLCYD